VNRKGLPMWREWLTVAAAWTPVVLLLGWVVPTFAEIFQNFGGELPWPTRWVVVAGHFVVLRWWAIPAVFLMVVSLQRIVGALVFGRTDVRNTRQVPGEEHVHLQKAARWVLCIHVAGAIIAVALIIVALYVPIFALGEVAGN